MPVVQIRFFSCPCHYKWERSVDPEHGAVLTTVGVSSPCPKCGMVCKVEEVKWVHREKRLNLMEESLR